VTITVTPVNDAPVLDPIPAQNVRWGNLLGFTAHAGDVDVPADSLIYSLVNVPAGVSVNPTTGAVSFTPTSAQVGVVTFKVRVTDSGSPNLFAEAPSPSPSTSAPLDWCTPVTAQPSSPTPRRRGPP
jgi:hypothetical protein